MRDIKNFHNNFYASNIKTEQDVLILKFTKFNPVKRHRPKNDKHASKKFHTKYYVPFHQDNGTFKSVQVCQAAFLGIIQVSRSRVETVIRNFMRNTESPKENRGGLRENRKAAYVRKQEAVIKFIQTLTVQESHYCRYKTSERKYLAADLNIRKKIPKRKLRWKLKNNFTEKGKMPSSSWYAKNVPIWLHYVLTAKKIYHFLKFQTPSHTILGSFICITSL